MLDLIEALQIFAKYSTNDSTHCEHDMFHVNVIPEIVSEEDKKRLYELSFKPSAYGGFASYRFGSC